MRLKIVALALCIAGCQHTPPPPSLIGQPLDAVVAKMGYPQSQRDFNGDTIYSWTESYIKTRWIFFQNRLACQVDVGIRDGRVKNIEYVGDSGPCYDLEYKIKY